MPSYTLGKRIDTVIAYLGNYDKVLNLSRGKFVQAIEWSRDSTFWGVFVDRSHLFLSAPISIADNTAKPVDWDGFVRAKTGAGKPFTYIEIEEIPGVKRFGLLQATADSPKIFICDGTLRVLPSGTTGTAVYFQHPVQLYFDDQTLIDESVTDTMPTDSEPLIARGAWELLLVDLVEQQAQGKLAEMQSNAVRELQARFFGDMTHELNPNLATQ